MRYDLKTALLCGIAQLALANAAWAQEAAPAAPAAPAQGDQAASTPAPDEKEGEVIVVTGTAGGAALRKQDASFAITSVSAADLAIAAPKSTAEVFTLVPGVWAESSGGKSGANIDVRGLPGGGDAPFVTLSINGAPIYGTPMLSFFEQSSIFRSDETVGSVEALRGGPNAVFGRGEPGVTLNFRLKEGGDRTKGRVKFTTSDYGLLQLDGVVSGKVTDNLYYMVGGYITRSHGIRDPQFNAEKGKQLTGQLTYRGSRGKVNLFTRWTNDTGQWYLPMALNTGNNLGTFAQLGENTRYATLVVDQTGRTETFDFAKGRGWKGSISGINAEFDVSDNVTLRDNLGYTAGNADTYGFVPSGGPVRVSSLPGGTASTAGGTVLAGTDWVQNYGHWVVKKDLKSLANDLSVAVKTGGNKLTIGYYHSNFSSKDFWTLGNFIPVQNVANGDRLSAATTCAMVEAAGGGGCWHYGIDSDGHAKVNALYVADSFQVNEALRFDAGLRREHLNIHYVLDSGPGYPDGIRDMNARVKNSKWAWTVAGNYAFNPDLGVFARYSSGFTMPHFDDIRENNLGVNAIKQTEVGLKYSGDTFRAFLTAFHNTNSSFDSVTGSVTPPTSYRTKSTGIEIDSSLRFGDFNLGALATFQNAKVTEALVGGVNTPALVGNQILRQPKFQVRLSPSYELHLSDWKVDLYGAAAIVGDRYGDLANTVVLKGFTKVDAGIKAQSPFGLFAQIHADNLFNSHGLTEGDPRNPTAPNGRPILGRSFRFSVGYDF